MQTVYVDMLRNIVAFKTKPQPGNDRSDHGSLVGKWWSVELPWASIAFFMRHVFSMLPLRHTLYNLSNAMVAKKSFDPVLVITVYLSV